MAGAVFAHVMPAVIDSDLANQKYFNLLKALRARREGLLLVDAQPFDITINVSTDRNAYHNSMIASLLDTLFIVRYCGTDESLLDPQLPEMITLLRDAGIYSLMSTSLSLKLDDIYIDNLIDSGLTMLSIACDGASRETYEKDQIGGDFDLVMRNMQRFIARKRERGLQYPLIEWRFRVCKQNEHDIDTARQLATHIGVDIIEFHSGGTPTTSGPAIDSALKRKDTPFRNLPAYGTNSKATLSTNQPSEKCDWLYFATCLHPKGKVAPCCHPGSSQQDMGIVQHELGDIWNNNNYQNARAYTKDNIHACAALCAECPQPKSKDRQFNHILSALVRNAPSWFLKTLAVDGDYWLHPLDRFYLAQELGRIDANRAYLAKTDCEENIEWLQTNKSHDKIAKRLSIKLLMAR